MPVCRSNEEAVVEQEVVLVVDRRESTELTRRMFADEGTAVGVTKPGIEHDQSGDCQEDTGHN